MFTLSVTDAESSHELEITHPAANLRVNWTLGSRVEVPCVARGYPSPLVKWTKLHEGKETPLRAVMSPADAARLMEY